jgi:hypothetical protein
MTHDEDIYPDPFSFKPERHFDEDGRLSDEDRVLAYGFGTRQVLLLLKYTGVESHVSLPQNLCWEVHSDRFGKKLTTTWISNSEHHCLTFL